MDEIKKIVVNGEEYTIDQSVISNAPVYKTILNTWTLVEKQDVEFATPGGSLSQ